jgi:beta-aspartyl-dipeptidase (metallo-type)
MQLLRHATVYAPAPRGVVDLLLGGGSVLAMGSLPEPPVGWSVEVLDLEGHVVIPGLVDLHVHLTGGGGEGGAHTRVPPLSFTALSRAGVTTAVGLLGTDGTTRTLAELLAAARALSTYGLTCFCHTGSYELPPVTLTGSIRGDIVHVDRFVAVGELALSDHRSSQPTFDELVRVASDAHVAGMMSGKAGLVHLHLGDGPRGLALLRRALTETELPARTFHPTHVNRNPSLFEEALELSAQGIYLDISAFPPDPTDQITIPSVEAVRRYLQSGLDPARLTVSSDAGGCLPTFDTDGVLMRMDVGDALGLLGTVRGCVAAGIELESVLRAVTSNPAALYRLPRKGQLAVGMDADLLVLGPGPQYALRHVMAGGRWLVRDGMAVVKGLFENA